jgi:hypothetical protein
VPGLVIIQARRTAAWYRFSSLLMNYAAMKVENEAAATSCRKLICTRSAKGNPGKQVSDSFSSFYISGLSQDLNA